MSKRLEDLADLIAAAKARPPMTEAELAVQKASFVRGQLGMGNDRDEAAYRKTLNPKNPAKNRGGNHE